MVVVVVVTAAAAVVMIAAVRAGRISSGVLYPITT